MEPAKTDLQNSCHSYSGNDLSRFHCRFRLHGLPEPRVLLRILFVPELRALLITLLRADGGEIADKGHGGFVLICYLISKTQPSQISALCFIVFFLIWFVPRTDLDDISFRVSDKAGPLPPGFGGGFQ